VRVEAHDRKRLEQHGRYITQQAPSDERVQVNAAWQVELRFRTPWRDGTTRLVMSPLELMQQPAALVHRPSSGRTGLPGSGRSRTVPDGRVPVATNGCFVDAQPVRGRSERRAASGKADGRLWVESTRSCQ